MNNLSNVKNKYIKYIDKLVDNAKISHTYLIEVGNYEEDFKYVFDFIKMILCNIHYDEIISSDNPIIKLIDANNYPDIKIIEPDGNYIKKSQLVELQKDFNNKSLYDNKRIYISSSANTILKFLEEPEEDIIAILLTDNRYHILETIISRCQILTLKEESFDFDENDDIINLLECIIKPKEFFIRYNYFISSVICDKDSALYKFSIIENILTQYMDYIYCGDISLNNDVVNVLKNVDTKYILYIISIFEDCIKKLEFNVNYKLWIDSTFSKLIIGG